MKCDVRGVKSSLCAIMLLATTNIPIEQAIAQGEFSSPAAQAGSGKQLKHKLAVGRFSNETRYGQSLLRDSDLDPLGKQAADILMAYLAQTGKFLLFERPDLSKIQGEQARGVGGGVIGVDTLIIGSIVEFGRAEDGKRGFLNKERTQRAHAKVAVRLVDVRTGQVFHSATGSGEATTATKTILGIGSTANFNGTLTDKALSVAVEDMLDELVSTLADRPWRSDILAVEAGQIFVAGGKDQGVRVGDKFRVMKSGRLVRSAQTGFEIALPPTQVAEIEVQSLFGDSEVNQGAVARISQGSITGISLTDLVVVPL